MWVFNNKTYIFVGLLFLFVVIMGIVAYFVSPRDPSENIGQDTFPTTAPDSPDNSLARTKIGITKEEDILKINGIRKTTQNGNETNYELDSFLIPRSNNIVTENGVVVFERNLIAPEKLNEGISIDYITEKYGTPEEKIKGSSFYGSFSFTYIYASKGAAFIVNPNTGEVFEAQYFRPTSIDSYKTRYGSDINPLPHEEAR